MPPEWLEDLATLGTDWRKPFLEGAPFLVAVFKRAYEVTPKGGKRKNHYVEESVGLACGLLLAAIQNAGLVTLTHTPGPTNFLSRLLDRSVSERPFLLLPVGYATQPCEVPDIHRKTLENVLLHYR